jgi:hypothetical protein
MTKEIKCPTCLKFTRRARHRGLYCEPCWSDWLDVSLNQFTELTDIHRRGVGQVTAHAESTFTDFAPPYKGGRSVSYSELDPGQGEKGAG